MATYYISGHLNLTREEFEEHYRRPIIDAHRSGARFVVGDAPGCDLMAQRVLKDLCAEVTVYHMFDDPRCNVGFPTRGGFMSDLERDEAMTAASDEDIAWVRPGRESSGTAKNLARRQKPMTLAEALDPRRRPLQMTLEEAEARLSNSVYAATELLERLEGAGLIFGNGHHVRQHLAEQAVELLQQRWRGPKPPA